MDTAKGALYAMPCLASLDHPDRFVIAIKLLSAALLGLALSAPAGAQPARVPELHSLPGSSLIIRGSTTIGAAWHCTSTDVLSFITTTKRAGDGIATSHDARSVMIRVPVSGLRCQSRRMERAMWQALKADRDTAARVIIGHFELGDGLPTSQTREVNLAGTLRVAGTERIIALRSIVTPLGDGSMSVHSEASLSLATFGISPPRVLLGVVRARDAVTIQVDLQYTDVRTARAFRPMEPTGDRGGIVRVLPD